MKILTLATALTALTLGGAAQAAPVPAQTGLLAPEGVVIQVRDRSMGHGSMRGMRHGGNMRGMRHGGGMRGMQHGRGMRGMRHGGNMRGMRHGGGMRGMQHGRGMRGMGNMRGMNHRM